MLKAFLLVVLFGPKKWLHSGSKDPRGYGGIKSWKVISNQGKKNKNKLNF